MFNALKYIKKLEAVGFPREQAEAQVQLVLDSIDSEVATKTEMSELRTEMAGLRSELKSDMATLRSELKTDFADLRADFAEFKTDVVTKLGATIVGSMTVATAIIGFLIKF